MNVQANEARHPLSFRILHGLIITSIIILIITGFYIHRPFVEGGGFLMAMARGVHFFFAAVLIIAAILRVIGMFVGKDRDWRSFIPTFSDVKLFPKIIGYYAYLNKEPVITKKYNPLQMISYCLAFILIIFQTLSGLALMWPSAFGWFNYMWFYSSIDVRIAHYVVMWLFIIFMMIHVYLAIRENFSEIKEMHLLSAEKKKETTKE